VGQLIVLMTTFFLHSRNCTACLFLDLQFSGGDRSVCVPKNRGPERLRTKLLQRRSTQKGGEPSKPAGDVTITITTTHSKSKTFTVFNLTQMVRKLSCEILFFSKIVKLLSPLGFLHQFQETMRYSKNIRPTVVFVWCSILERRGVFALWT
jgi:hypothetical protein